MQKQKKVKGLQRARESKDAYRLYHNDIPLITDRTEEITPEIAQKMLQKNKNNRPVNWRKVGEYRKIMERGEWKLHGQGIILDDKENIITGQKRLHAIILAGIPVYMRVSRGTPADRATLIDRGTPQSSRDLASRGTDRKHSPTEAAIVRAIFAFEGILRPSVDAMADKIIEYTDILENAMLLTKGTKKTKSVKMIMACICHLVKLNYSDKDKIYMMNVCLGTIKPLAKKFEKELEPVTVDECWNKGAAFKLAMQKAMTVCYNAAEIIKGTDKD
jgi:hypothetical protein